jgi:hypothetical protein
VKCFVLPLILRGEAGWLSAIALGYGLDEQGFESRQGLGIFLFTTASRPALGTTQPPIQWVPGALFLGVKRPRHEADHSPPSSAENKNAWSYISTPQYAFVTWCSVNGTVTTLPYSALGQGFSRLQYRNHAHGTCICEGPSIFVGCSVCLVPLWNPISVRKRKGRMKRRRHVKKGKEQE